LDVDLAKPGPKKEHLQYDFREAVRLGNAEGEVSRSRVSGAVCPKDAR